MVSQPVRDRIEQRSRELFNDSVSRLDGHTRSKLNQARQTALKELNKGASRRYWLVAPLGGLAAAVLVAVMLTGGRIGSGSVQESASLPLDDFDIVADADDIDMIQDVEFYSWMPGDVDASADSSG